MVTPITKNKEFLLHFVHYPKLSINGNYKNIKDALTYQLKIILKHYFNKKDFMYNRIT